MSHGFPIMKGCRPLSHAERQAILEHCREGRERALLVLGVATGYRISELLSLDIGDVIDEAGAPRHYVTVEARNTKTKEGRTIVLGGQAGKVLAEYAGALRAAGAGLDGALFPGRKGRHMSRCHAWRILKSLFARSGIAGAVATHTLRKTFAAEMYKALDGRIEKVQKALGHKSITSTVCYLSFNAEEVDRAIEEMEI